MTADLGAQDRRRSTVAVVAVVAAFLLVRASILVNLIVVGPLAVVAWLLVQRGQEWLREAARLLAAWWIFVTVTALIFGAFFAIDTITFVYGIVGLLGLYVWHRREVRAGRRAPVWFGKRTDG